MVTWSTATDWDNAASETGVEHTTQGDRTDDAAVRLGYATDWLPASLELLYVMDESSSPVVDYSGNNRDGTPDSATFDVSGIHGTTGITLTQGNDITSASFAPFGTAATIAVWLNLNSIPGTLANEYICEFYENNDHRAGILARSGSNGLTFWLEDGSLNLNPSPASETPTAGQYDLVVLALDNSSAELYLNDNQVNSDSYSASFSNIGNGEFVVNDWQNDGGNGIDADYEVAMMFSEKLSRSQITDLYDAGTGGEIITSGKTV